MFNQNNILRLVGIPYSGGWQSTHTGDGLVCFHDDISIRLNLSSILLLLRQQIVLVLHTCVCMCLHHIILQRTYSFQRHHIELIVPKDICFFITFPYRFPIQWMVNVIAGDSVAGIRIVRHCRRRNIEIVDVLVQYR
jgi:hypothetical protein